MTKAPLADIPTHVIAGPLGAGKTSLIRHLLSQRPSTERWAVLINEFGQIGIDAALLETGADGITIAEIPGGCLCCVNGVPFQVGLGRLLRRARPDRLFIEASGLGHPAPLMRQLAGPPWNNVLRVHPLTLVLDASALAAGGGLSATQTEALALAGLLVMNKSEALDAPARERAGLCLPELKKVWCSQGRVSLGSLPSLDMAGRDSARPRSIGEDLVQTSAGSPEPRRLWLSPEQWQLSEQTGDSGNSIGWIMSPAVCFNRSALDRWLLAVDWRRAKGVLHTTDGWLRFNAVAGADVEWEHQPARPDNRLELISEAPLDAKSLEASLRETVHCG